MSQHTYTLKFTVKATYEGVDANLDQVLKTENEVDYTREDLIKAEVEERIKKIIPELKGDAQVVFDELTES